MAKTAIQVDRTLLENIIANVESNGPLINRNALYKKVSESYNAGIASRGLKPIKAGVVFLRIRDWGLQVKTPIGKRGRQAGSSFPGSAANRKSRSDKFKSDPVVQKSFKSIRQYIGNEAPRLLPIVDRIEDGSMKAAVKLKCLECCNWQPNEVAKCSVNDCALFAFRPYKE